MGNWKQVKLLVRTVCISYESKKGQPYAQTCVEGLRDVSLPLGKISDPCLLCSALHEPQCLSHEFIGLAKFALDKKTSKSSQAQAL